MEDPLSGMATTNNSPVNNNNSVQSTQSSQSSVTSKETAVNVELTSQEIDFLAEIEKRDEKVKKLEDELMLLKKNGETNNNILDASNLESKLKSGTVVFE